MFTTEKMYPSAARSNEQPRDLQQTDGPSLCDCSSVRLFACGPQLAARSPSSSTRITNLCAFYKLNLRFTPLPCTPTHLHNSVHQS